jgi:hypothetical protein
VASGGVTISAKKVAPASPCCTAQTPSSSDSCFVARNQSRADREGEFDPAEKPDKPTFARSVAVPSPGSRFLRGLAKLGAGKGRLKRVVNGLEALNRAGLVCPHHGIRLPFSFAKLDAQRALMLGWPVAAPARDFAVE